ncbi:MAG TPA: ABC transporter substrate-binding protein, partial [Burkholderiales bacterium]|nr:ABC transporter substrate-binding protein [Burkholderiales bacterium]
MITRRDVLVAIAAGPLAPRASFAQPQPKTAHIGVLLAGTPAGFAPRTEAFLQELRRLGYVEGKNLVIEWRWAENQPERIPRLAAELVGLNVDVIVTGGTSPARALKNATRTIPIVMALVGDPVATGLVESLARPGANLTGFSDFAPAMTAKRLEILKEIAPQASRVAVLLNQTNPNGQVELNAARTAASALGIQLLALEISEPATLEAAFEKAAQQRAGAFTVLTDPMLYSQRTRIVTLVANQRLPAMYPQPEYAEAGGLISYGQNSRETFRRSAVYVDRILKGTKPADLPIEQPSIFEMVVNAKTAKTLGIA